MFFTLCIKEKHLYVHLYMNSSDAKASKCHLKFSSKMIIFIKLVCHLSEITELKHTSLIKMVILEENFKWHLEAFASNHILYSLTLTFTTSSKKICMKKPLAVAVI